MASRRIMVVDDNEGFLDELEEILALSGYEVVRVDDVNQALDTAYKTKPEVVLLDLKMPGKSGFQLAYEIKNFTELEHVPVLAMSAFFKDEYTTLMNMCGIKKCLRKPFNPLDVIMEIEKVLE